MVGITRWYRWPLALGVALLSLSLGLGTTFAAPGTGQGTKGNASLAQGYATAQRHLAQQEKTLQRYGAFADRVAQAITKAKTKGKDTTALEEALATFRQELDQARANWQAASDTLAGHAGFDDQGKVTDAATARESLTSAHDSMLSAHTTLVGARADLRKALATFRKANRGVEMPEVPAAPSQP